MSNPPPTPQPSPEAATEKKDLTLPTTVFSLASALALQAMSLAGWNSPWLVWGLAASALALFVVSVSWSWLAARIGVVRRATAFVATHARTRLSVRMVGLVAFLFAVYGAVVLARVPAGPASQPTSAVTVSPDPVPGRPPGRTRVQRAFLSDFAAHLRLYRNYDIEEVGGDGKATLNVQRVLNFESNADFLAVYIPGTPLTFSILLHIVEEWNGFLESFRDFMVTRQDVGDVNRFGGEDLRFSGLVYFYSEAILSIEEMADLQRLFREKGVTVQFRHLGTLRSEQDAR